jgi:hypothetical protein
MDMGAGVEYLVLPSVALIINLLLICFLIRQKRVIYATGFRESFVLLFAFNAVIIAARISAEMAIPADAMPVMWKVGITATMCIGGISAGIATRLYRPTPRKTAWQTIIPTIKYPPCFAIIVAFLSIAALAWIFTPFRTVGVIAYFEPWYALCLGIAGIWSLTYIPLLLLKYSRKLGPAGKRSVMMLIAGYVLLTLTYAIIGLVSPYLRAPYNAEFFMAILPLVLLTHAFRAPIALEQILPAAEGLLPGVPELKLGAGRTYMVKGDLDKAYEVFFDQVGHGIPGLCISKLESSKIRERYGLKKTPIIWVTFRGVEEAVNPRDLGGAKRMASEIAERAKRGVILLDCFDVFKTVHGFERAFGFLREIKGMMAASGWSMLVSVDPRAFTAEQLRALERELEGVGA